MPTFMDRHELSGASPADAARAHVLDLEIQERYGVRYKSYYFDDQRQTAFCVAEGPSREAVEAVHRDSHGMLAHHIIQIDPAEAARYLGPLVEHPPGEPYVDPAFRVVLFTDIEDSTRLTQQLGDAAAMSLVRAHDRLVREALAQHAGAEVKHTGDGIMASFRSIGAALACAQAIQRGVDRAADQLAVPFRLRIGIAAGEPVIEGNDLFGTVVQLAARLAAKARPGSVLLPAAIRDLTADHAFRFGARRRLRLKGFADAVPVCELDV